MGAGTGLEEKGTVDLKTKYVKFKVCRYKPKLPRNLSFDETYNISTVTGII